MPCYSPRVMVACGVTSNGKTKYKFIPGAIGTNHTQEYIDSLPAEWRDKVINVPCKKCAGCRLDYSRRWADRMMLELDHSKTAVFITLTYNDEHLPYGDIVWMPDPDTGEAFPTRFPTVVKRDIQLFNKRLREYFSHKEIRFYLCSEYGPRTARPHYHGIYFGLSLDDFEDLKPHSFNSHKQPLYTSPRLEKLWKNGFVSLANVSWQTCAYVARYSLKKRGADKGLSKDRGVVPEFALMSRNPGIGGYFHLEHPEIMDNPTDKIFLSDPYGVKSVNSISLPEYNFKKLELTNPELYANIKEQRKKWMNDSFFAEYLQQDLDQLSYLDVKHQQHINRSAALSRDAF